MKIRPHPPLVQPQELLDFSSEHLAYEVLMLLLAVRAADANAELDALEPRFAAFVRNARVEAFANHLRNLVTFLYSDCYDQWKGDVFATDFFASDELRNVWLKDRPPLSESLKAAKRRADKEMAHITVDRITGTADIKRWEFGPLGREIISLLQAFATAADTARLHAKGRRLLDCDG